MRVLIGSVQVCLALLFGLRSCNKVEHPQQEPSQLAMAGGLVLGQPAPDICGEDIEGVPHKLSDYRGKVVVLDFWASW